MVSNRLYGTDQLFLFGLVLSNESASGVTIAAGDAKVWTDQQPFANPSAESVGFTSLSELPSSGATLVGATSTETCTFMFAVITSGTVAGGDAAGVLFVKSVSGVFQAENLNIQGGTANVMTIAGDFTAGVFGEIGQGLYCLALTASEMTCERGAVQIKDQAGAEYESTAIPFETYGHTNAFQQVDYTDGTRFGLTALPNADADAAGGLPISDAGGLDLDQLNADVSAILVDTGTTIPDKLLAYVQLITRIDAAIATDRATELAEINANEGSGAGAYDNTDDAQEALQGDLTTLRNKLLAYVQLLARKDAAIATDNATALSEINANEGSGAGAYDNTTDAQEGLELNITEVEDQLKLRPREATGERANQPRSIPNRLR